MNKTAEECIKIIKEFENPYPPDIFRHDNPEAMAMEKNGKTVPLTRGRFNRHVWEVVKNTRNKIIEMIEEELE